MENSDPSASSAHHVQSIREIFESKTNSDVNPPPGRRDSSSSITKPSLAVRTSFLYTKIREDALSSSHQSLISEDSHIPGDKETAREANPSSFLHSPSNPESPFNAQTRISIKRSPAFRQDKKAPSIPRENAPEPPRSNISASVTSKAALFESTTNNNSSNSCPLKKVSLKRKPPITTKPACLVKSPLHSQSNEASRLAPREEEDVTNKISDPNEQLAHVLHSPLPPGPPPQKPPRTFLHDVYSEIKLGKCVQETSFPQDLDAHVQPQKPLRKKGRKNPPVDSEDHSASLLKENLQTPADSFVLIRSKTEPSLSPRKNVSESEEPTESTPISIQIEPLSSFYAVTNLNTSDFNSSSGGVVSTTQIMRRKQVAIIKPQVPIRPLSTCLPAQAPMVSEPDRKISLTQSLDEEDLEYSCTESNTSRVSNPVRWNQFNPEVTPESVKRPKSTSPGKTATIKRLSASVLPLTNLKTWKDMTTGSQDSLDVKPLAKTSSKSSLTINRTRASTLTSSSPPFLAAAPQKATSPGRKHLTTPKTTFSDGRRSLSAEHIYSEPILRQNAQRTPGRWPGALHYMSTSIVEKDEHERKLSSVDLAVAVTPEEDSGSDVTESDNDEIERSQIVEDRKIYVRRVSSNVCDLERKRGGKFCLDVSGGQRLFEVFLVVGLYYDRDLKVHLPYIKSRYPSEATVPVGIEELCFPDSAQWPPSTNSSQPYTLVLTDHKGRRHWAYCKRIVPEGSQTVIPIAYCLVSRHRAPALYSKVICELTSCHGLADTQFRNLLESLHQQSFPRPGGFIKFELPAALCHSPMVIKRGLDSGLEESDLDLLYARLDNNTLVHVLGTLLLERKLVFVSDHLNVVSGCVQGLLSMINPFLWHHTLVPVLPSSMFEVASAPTPYVMGVLRCSIQDWEVLEPDQGMLVDLDSGRVLHSVGDEATLLPRRLSQALKAALASVPSLCMAGEPARNALLAQTFLCVFVELCGHYQSHIAFEKGEKIFRREDFIASHPSKSVQMFLEWFTETAMFTLFIESRLKDGPVISSQFERKVLEHSDLRNSPLILRNQKLFSRKMRTIGDRLRDMNVFG